MEGVAAREGLRMELYSPRSSGSCYRRSKVSILYARTAETVCIVLCKTHVTRNMWYMKKGPMTMLNMIPAKARDISCNGVCSSCLVEFR